MARRYRPNSWLWVYCGKNSCTTSQTSLMCLIPFWLGFGISTFMHYRNKEENFNLLVFCWSSPCHLSEKQPAYSFAPFCETLFQLGLELFNEMSMTTPFSDHNYFVKKKMIPWQIGEIICLIILRAWKWSCPVSSSERIDFLAERVTFEAYLPNRQGSRQLDHPLTKSSTKTSQ